MAQVTEPAAVDRHFLGALARNDSPAIARGLERAARTTVAAGAFLVPVVFDPRTIDSFNLAKISVLWVVEVAAAVLWWAAVLIGGRRAERVGTTLVVRLSAALLVVAGVATVFSPSRTLSVFGLYHRYGGLVSLAMYVGLVALMGALYRRRPDALHEIAVAAAGAAAVVALYVVLQHAGADPYRWRVAGGPPRFPIGTMGNSEFTAAYLGIAVPFVVYLAAAARSLPRRIVWVVVGGLAIVGVWWTQGRSGMLAAAAGTAALFMFRSRFNAGRKVAAVFVLLVALAVVPVIAGNRHPVRTTVFRTESLSYRRETWDAAWRMLLRRPGFGWGPETYFGLYPTFRTAADGRAHGLTIPDKPHNIYLDWAVSTGMVGLAVYVLLVGAVLTAVARAATAVRPPRRWLAAAFGGGLVAYLVQGMYSIDVPPLAFAGWVAIGAIGVLSTDADRGARPAPVSGRATSGVRRPPVVVGAGGVLILFAVGAGLGPLRADHAAWAAERRSGGGWSRDTMALYQRAIDLDPREAAYKGLQAAYLERVGADPRAPDAVPALRRAASLYEQAIALQPRNIYFMINAARVDASLGRMGDLAGFARADHWLGRVVALDVRDPEARDQYADLLELWSMQEKDTGRRRVLERRARTQRAVARSLRSAR